MQVPPEISFRNVEKTETLNNLIDEEVKKLDKAHRNLISCRLAIERPHRAQRTGNPFRVRLGVRVPRGNEVVVTRDFNDSEMHEPLGAVLRDVFQTARQQLRELRELQRRDVKKHPEQEAAAVVEKLYSDEGYGFLRTIEGEQIYFHRNSVLHNDFDRLEIGTGVRYAAKMGEKGLQASTVQIVDKPGVRTGKTDGDQA